jgi:pimeloyl-ACP methyl ester carboxylesterase
VSGGAANAASPAFVAVPGYGSGSSFLFKLFDGLSSAFRFYAIDMLGTGLSGGWVGAALPAFLLSV